MSEASIESDGIDVFVVYNGVRIAKRGQPNSPQAGTWVSLEPGFRVFDKDYPAKLVIERDGKNEESEDQSNVVLNPSMITEPAIRAAKIITGAFEQFITEEKKRLGENAPALPGIVALGNAVGAGLAAVILSHGINGKNAREALETILSLTKSEGESLLGWSEKTKPLDKG